MNVWKQKEERIIHGMIKNTAGAFSDFDDRYLLELSICHMGIIGR